MPRLPEQLRKLKGKSFDELRARCVQAARVRLERAALTFGSREPTDASFARLIDCEGVAGRVGDGELLLRRFRRHDLGRFLPGLSDIAVTAQHLRTRCPAAAAATITAADCIASGVIELGGHVVCCDRHPDWTLEPVSGKRAPAIHWSRIAYLDPQVAGDSKFTWELNRHQYLALLGRAYALTDDDRYASVVADHLSSWMDNNPPEIGINWTSSLELALRAISWIWALALVRRSQRITAPLFHRVLKYLHLQARHIEQNLSTYFSPNTHLTGEALGLLYIGTAFPEFKRAAQWRALGTQILEKQIERQLFGDGVYFEQSTYYHRYTADFYLHALRLTETSTPAFGAAIRPKLDLLLDYLVAITRPDGSSPFIGDDDGGRLVMLGERAANDFRDTLAIGAAMMGRGDCAYVAGDAVEELIWLLGPQGLRRYDRLDAAPPNETSRAFAASGYYVMREHWGRDADWALIRCGPHPPQLGAHAHADALSVELSLGGQPVLIDPGTYVYTASRTEREHFRSTAAHSTLTVDGTSSAEPAASPFKWASAPKSRTTAWVCTATFDFLEGEHDGYSRLAVPAVHSRAVFHLKGEYWIVRDRIRSDGAHRLALYWHWAPGLTPHPDTADGFHQRTSGAHGAPIDVKMFAREGRLSCDSGWISTTYGTRVGAPVSVLRMESDGTEEIVTIFARDEAGVRMADCSWQQLKDRDASVVTIETVSARDMILTGPSALSSEAAGEGILSDAKWTWVRWSRSGELLEFALVQGRRLVIDHRAVFESEGLVKCVSGKRRGSAWDLEVQPLDGSSPSTQRLVLDGMESCVASAE
jgi:Heparinase II/III-like protein/Heparinase II/III N-terminus